MQKAPTRAVFDVITDFLATSPSPETLLAYHFPDDLQKRADYLIEKNGEGDLTIDEQKELDDFVQADEMMTLLKVKTKLRLKKDNP
ncbi:MAG: hypothetical protein AAFR67_18285 [Chloroflexota bacterium]